ncbi:MAG: M20/M25/M40 family metallo-hydrolase [Acidobacteriota bacterium]
MMKKLSFLLFLPLLFSGCSSSGTSASDTIDLITPDLMNKHISFLASDELKGRKTPSEDLDKAAHYIADEFKNLGLKPVNGSYFQRVHLGRVDLGKNNSLVIKKDGKERSFSIKTEFTPFEMTGNKEVSSSIVFAGYGITSPELKYDDYKDIDVNGKIVLLLRHAPGENDTASVFSTKTAEAYSQGSTKVKNAIEHGAKGVILVTDPLNHSLLSPRGFPWPALSALIPKDALPIALLSEEKDKVPVVQAGKEVIDLLFGSLDRLKELQKEIDAKLTPKSFEIPGTSVFLKTTTDVMETPASNVVGLLEGSDPALKDELVIAGAHYDHVGYRKEHKEGEDYIYNGADDNASGTSGVMALARAFSAMNPKPKRSILFIAFAGEELGLLGSKAYTENPLFPLEKTVAMLNMDMIGRNDPDSLFIIGSSVCPELSRINKEENIKIGFKLGYTLEKFLGASDQESFIEKGVPSIFYNTGETKDYHTVRDEVSTINMIKAARVVRLVFLTALRISEDGQYNRTFYQPISHK